MNRIFIKNHASKPDQNGFALIAVLLLIGILGSILTGVSLVKSNETLLNSAKIAGWEGSLLSKAARIYVRDRVTANPNLKNNLAGNPTEIFVSELINLDLLPPNFARMNGGEYFNALNQKITIMMANYPIDGDPADPDTSAAAYVIFEKSNKTTADLMYDVANSLFNNNVAVQAPIFDGTINLSGSCGISDSVSTWDSGCISATQYEILTAEAFVPGALIIPAWQSAQFDTRAILRFPSIENSGQQTMLTDLKMATMHDCTIDPINFITVPSDSGINQQTNFCGSVDDDTTTTTDNRRSISNINNLSGNYYITDTQTGADGVFTNYQTGVSTIQANNNVVIGGSLTTIGDVKSYGNSVDIDGTLETDRNITLSSDTGVVPPSMTVNNIDTGNIFTNTLEVNRRADIASSVSISGTASNINEISVANELVANSIVGIGSNPIVTVANDLDVTNTITADSLTVVNGANKINDSSVLTALINTQDIALQNDVIVADTAYLRGNTNTNVINITNANLSAECFGDCPLRTEDEQCQNIASSGIQTYEDCMAGFR